MLKKQEAGVTLPKAGNSSLKANLFAKVWWDKTLSMMKNSVINPRLRSGLSPCLFGFFLLFLLSGCQEKETAVSAIPEGIQTNGVNPVDIRLFTIPDPIVGQAGALYLGSLCILLALSMETFRYPKFLGEQLPCLDLRYAENKMQ